MEERGLAASSIDRRLSTACGFYRFAPIDFRIASNRAQYVRRWVQSMSKRAGLSPVHPQMLRAGFHTTRDGADPPGQQGLRASH